MVSKLFLLIALTSILQAQSDSNCATSPSDPSKSKPFDANLFREISKTRTDENVIISPLSIQTALAMVYLGAEGQTACELAQGLRLPSTDKTQVGSSFAQILNAPSGEAKLNIANRLFVSSTVQLQPTFNERALKYFNSEAESVDFNQKADAVKTINTWVEEKTNKKITNLLEPDSIGSDTGAIIVNAIYFKGKWQAPFNKDTTFKDPFWTSQTSSVLAHTMHLDDEKFKYAELLELKATAIELPYENSKISMIIVLPNERDGLAKLEQKLSSISINQLLSRLTIQDCSVSLPKFKIEFSVGLNDKSKGLGIDSIFEDTANLTGIFKSGERVKVTDLYHKAFIDVNEAGSEAAAASYSQLGLRTANYNQKIFIADHPFVFAITSPDNVYFVGHVAKP